MAKRIYLCLAHMSEAGLEQKYIKEAFDTNWVVPLGPNVNAFEEDLRHFVISIENGKFFDLKVKASEARRKNENLDNLPDGVVCQTSGTSVAYINGVSEGLFKRGLCLPSGPMVTDEDVKRIIEVIKLKIEN